VYVQNGIGINNKPEKPAFFVRLPLKLRPELHEDYYLNSNFYLYSAYGLAP